MAKEINVSFFVKGYRETDPVLRPNDARYRAKPLPKPCTDIYHQLGIYWNGDVVPCCYDTDGANIMGSITKDTLSTIWKSALYNEFRNNVKNVLSDPEKEPAVCKSCLRWR